ncbi:MAG: electron transport complex subunit RsxC [Bilifractor sp.]|jgi:electron transport complex protein RnfC
MGFLTFKGGVHPDDGKSLSKDQAIQTVEAGDKLYFSVSQHIGAPAKPIVEKGDHVLRGQMIAEAGGFVSAPVFSSVSGTVAGIEKKRMPAGNLMDCIVVENDRKYEEIEYDQTDWHSLSKEEVLERIKNGGVVGMGGAGFPTHVKLSPKDPDKIDFIQVNGAECEPYLTSDYRMMIEHPDRVAEGLRIMLSLFPHAKGQICIENNKMDCVEKMKAATSGDSNIEVHVMKTKYPQGAERMLIFANTGRAINSSMLPADAGCIVDNVGTVCAVYEAVALGKPLMERIVTVTGDAANKPGNFLTPTGMLFSEVIEQAGGLKDGYEKLISGGPMMGFSVFTTEIPITKTSGGILAMMKDEVAAAEPSACINCGRCVSACPEHLIPTRLAVYADHNDKKRFLAGDGMECCECGSCTFVCPAKRQLAQSIKSMRKICLADRKKKK